MTDWVLSATAGGWFDREDVPSENELAWQAAEELYNETDPR